MACPGWSESSLGAHVILFVLSCAGSYQKAKNRKSLHSISLNSKLNKLNVQLMHGCGQLVLSMKFSNINPASTWIGERLRVTSAVDLVNVSAYAKFGLIPAVCSLDIGRKWSWNDGIAVKLKTVYLYPPPPNSLTPYFVFGGYNHF